MTDHFTLALAQTEPVKGDVEANARDHAACVRVAAEQKADLIVFPELSLTGYEAELAAKLALSPDDARFNALAQLSARYDMTIIASAPIKNPDGKPFIGGLIFKPSERQVYLKQRLHPGEEKYFSNGDKAGLVKVKGVILGLAICADISVAAFAQQAAAQGASLYAASAFITPAGYEKDSGLLRGYASRHRMAVALANYCGMSGGLAAAGRSAVWGEDGKLIIEADKHMPSIVVAVRAADEWTGKVIT